MEAQCPKCGGEMKVWIISRPVRPVFKVVSVVLLIVLVGIVIYAVGLTAFLGGVGNLIGFILVIGLSLAVLKGLWPTIWAAIDPAPFDWNGSKARQEYERKRTEWEKERKEIEKMMAKDPSRVRMFCKVCGPLQ